MFRSFVSLLSASLCASCIAVGVVVPSREDVPLESYAESMSGVTPNRADLRARLAARGLAPEVLENGEDQTWWVEHSGRFCGIVAVVPVLLPICRSHDLYRFEGDRLLSHSAGTSDFHGIVCSPFFDVGAEFETGDGGRFWCGIE